MRIIPYEVKERNGRMRKWAKEQGLEKRRPSRRRHDCFRTFLGLRCDDYYIVQPGEIPCSSGPWDDHPMLFYKDGVAHTYTFQPYKLEVEIYRERMIAYFQEMGLDMEMSEDDSWWNPRSTVLVTVRHRS